jgi:D-alanyl-D-alanine carboxypeptidase
MHPGFEWGGGGFATSALDLARWLAAFCEGRAFDASLLTQVFAGIDAPDLGRGAKYGLGVHIDVTPLGRAIGHGGFFPGYVSWVRWYEAKHIAVALQINTSDDHLFKRRAADLLDDCAAALLADH